MKNDDHLDLGDRRPDLPEDRELSRLLASWRTPETPSELDERVFASYRGHFNRGRFWRRWLAGSIRIPVPIAAAAVLLLCATSFLAARDAAIFSSRRKPGAVVTKIVEVPVQVIQEKIVTRVIRLKSERGSPKPDSVKSARDANNAARSDLAGFRPVNKIDIVVISGGNNNE